MAVSENTRFSLNIINFIALVVFIIGGVWSTSYFVKDIESKVEANTKEIEEIKPEVEELSDKVHDQQIATAEIKTKLVNIEYGILEIKSILKDK